MIYDTFMFHDELDVLECRLVELEPVKDLVHVIVEAERTHQGQEKPSYLLDNWARFSKWADRIVHVWATDLPTVEDAPDPWAREHAQREWTARGLTAAQSRDIVLHGDVDEIPTAVAARNVRPTGILVMQQRLACFAVDWIHPDPWNGTVATRVESVRSFAALRDARNVAPVIPGAGWHLSWLGGDEANLRKLAAFCHPEVADRIHAGLGNGNRFLTEGRHVDGAQMVAVDVDRTWPKWVHARQCPDNWFRPRVH